MKEYVIAILGMSENLREFLDNVYWVSYCEYTTVSVSACYYMHVYVCLRVKYRSCENKYVHGYTYKSIFVCATANKCILHLSTKKGAN